MSRALWTADDALAQLVSQGIVWNLGQLSPAAVRRLNKVCERRRAYWPWITIGTCQKTCWALDTTALEAEGGAFAALAAEQP